VKPKPYQTKNRRRCPKPTPASLLCPPQNVTSIKDSEGSMVGSTHASTVYSVLIIEPKTKHILPTVLPT